jgi:hypothetical protein
MKLIPDARNWWKLHSNWVFGLFAVFPVVWLSSPDLQAMLPPKLVSEIAPVVAVLGIAARMRKQALKPPMPKPTVPADNDFHQRDP